jgi:hypothetical protein
MNRKQYSVTITKHLYDELQSALFPGDGYESVAFGLCSRASSGDRERLIVQSIYPISSETYIHRSDNCVTWSTELLRKLLLEAAQNTLSILKLHSHPSGYQKFSSLDNKSDVQIKDTMVDWMVDTLCASVIMTPDGKLFGRIVLDNGFLPIDCIQVVGHELKFFHSSFDKRGFNEWKKKNAQAFGDATTSLLSKLKIGVVGCSGTGSPLIEQLTRLGVGGMVLVDPDRVEEKNLNRILNSTTCDAQTAALKVDVMKRAVFAVNPQCNVSTYAVNIYDSEQALRDLSTCDVIFGCVDSIDGRHLLNLISTYYCIPYIDLGVKLIADGRGEITKICGSIHSIAPGGSSLMSRGVYTSEDLTSASFLRHDPEEYLSLVSEKYIKNVSVEKPAVVSINMVTASSAVNEFLCKIHHVRAESMDSYAVARLCISDGYLQYEAESDPDLYFLKFVARGDCKPFLGQLNFDF